jgi:hypothetical protein
MYEVIFKLPSAKFHNMEKSLKKGKEVKIRLWNYMYKVETMEVLNISTREVKLALTRLNKIT